MESTDKVAKDIADEWPENPLDKLINIPAEATKFKTTTFAYFRIAEIDDLPIDRFIQFEKYLIQLGFTASFEHFESGIREAMAYCSEKTDQGPYMAYTVLYNILQGVTDMANKKSVKLLMCTLFLLREDEEAKRFDSNIAVQKIADWSEHGFNMGFFLDLADSIAIGFNERSLQLFQALGHLPTNPIATTERIESLRKA